MINKRELELYLHIPFCVRKCMYCDFLSAPADSVTIHAYMKALEEEIESRAVEFGDYIVVSVFVGGGTPSIAETKDIEAVLTAIRHSYRLADDAEITIEVNPGTVERKKLEAYRSVGVNRLSIGLQSARNEELKRIGRIHSWQQFLDSYRAAVEAGFENVNVDIMSTLPGQSLENYRETLRSVLALEPCVKHISAYSLIVEEGTPMFEDVENKKVMLPPDELEREMYWTVKRLLEQNGYKHYEISNFAKPSFESKHNMHCWEQNEYIGMGVAAHSYTNDTRYSNIDTIEEYIENYKNGKQVENFVFHEKQDKSSKMNEYMILGLRQIDGVEIQKFKAKFGENPIYIYHKELEKLVNEDLIEIDGDIIKLTNKGLDLANLVWEEFV